MCNPTDLTNASRPKFEKDEDDQFKYHWYSFFLRVLSTAVFALAVGGCVGIYFIKTSLFDAGAAFDLPDEALDSTNEYTFTLWNGSDFWSSTSLCGETPSFGTWLLFGVDPPDLSSVGECSTSTLRALQGMATTATLAAGLRVFFVVVPKNFPRAFLIGCFLDFLTFIMSLSVVCIYSLKVDPTRLSPSYCDGWLQIRPDDVTLECEEFSGKGYYCQILVTILSLFSLVAELVGRPGEKSSTYGLRGSVTVIKASDSSNRRFFTMLCLNQTLRFAEFTLILLGIFGPYVVLSLYTGSAVESGPEIDAIIRQSLFDEFLCKHNLWWGRFGVSMSTYDTLGSCSASDLRVAIGCICTALALSAMSLVGLKNAKFFPKLYLMGVGLEVLTLIFVSTGIGYFAARIYPGRKSLDPAYCDLWLGEYPPEFGSSCNISLGYSFISLCVALGLCVINLFIQATAKKSLNTGIRTSLKILNG